MADYKNARSNINLYYTPIEMPGGYSFDYVKTLKKIDLYYNSQFETGNLDSRGFRKFFYNIVKPACDIAQKYIDLDTKDIVLISEKPDSEMKVWLMQRDLKQWLKKEKFGSLLNRLGEEYPKYGHFFIKKDKSGSWKKVNIQNLRFDPASNSFDTDEFFYEIHQMSRNEIKRMKWNRPDDVEGLLSSEENIYTVYECYDRCADEKGEWRRTIKADLYLRKDGTVVVRAPEALINNPNDYIDGRILHEDYADELPYREHKWEDVPGRRLGRGYVEYLFDNQISINELVNIKRKGLYYTSLKLYQTRDDSVGKNVLTDVENGDIIKTTAEINPVVNEERNLAVFNSEEQRWDQNTVSKTFTTDISRGENLPSRTPLGVANLQAAQVASFFELKRENLGMFIKDLFLDDVIPNFKNKSKREHILTFLGSDPERSKLDQAIAEVLVEEKAMEYAEKTGFFPDPASMELEKARVMGELKKKRNLYLDVPAGFYEDAEYNIDILVTGEQLDTGARIQTLQIALQLFGTNPMILRDKGTRTVLFKLLELGGVSPVELNLIGENAESPEGMMAQATLPQGGSVAMPQNPGGMEGRMMNEKML